MARYDFIAVYLLANRKHGALYCGVTSDLPNRLALHRLGKGSAFTAKYGCNRLVWFERYVDMPSAIRHEKRIKRWPRSWKIDLFATSNPDWRDVSMDVLVS
ncbi:MAG: GIY-YIG nuclease family protein [Pseudomonadota bacterium]